MAPARMPKMCSVRTLIIPTEGLEHAMTAKVGHIVLFVRTLIIPTEGLELNGPGLNVPVPLCQNAHHPD